MSGRRHVEPWIVNPATHPRRYVSLRVAARYLEVDGRTLNKYIHGGILAAVAFGARRKVEVAELVAFERRQRQRHN